MRSLLFLAILAATAHAEPSPTGCWEVGGWAPTDRGRLEITGQPGHVAYRLTVQRPDEKRLPIAGTAVPVRRTPGELELLCRPTSQHGSFCRVRREGDGLRVRVFAHGHRSQTTGKLVADFVAPRCR